MLPFVTFSILILIHRCVESSHIQELLKKHPTWSFEVVSIDAVIKEAAHALKSSEPSLTEDVLSANIKSNFGPETTHIVRKIGDPKWSDYPPATFDAREKWKGCAKLITDVEDEGPCYSDSPPVAASVAADRYCIFTNETSRESFSQEWLAGCVESCLKRPFIPRSYEYIIEHGIPTGGQYMSEKGCLPYASPPCKHSNSTYFPEPDPPSGEVDGALEKLKACEDMAVFDHGCPTRCSNPKYKIPLEKDLKKFTAWYWLPSNEFCIRQEIQRYGPVATTIILFDDFFEVKNGMYRKKDDANFRSFDKYLKIIGWGKEEGTKYWLVVNTWGEVGDSKVFKIPRGTDHVGVEYQVSTGTFESLYD